MKKAFDLIVFDWDGTLMDSTTAITRSIRSACADLDLPVPDEKTAAYVIGLSMVDAFRIACPEASTEQYPLLIAAYQNHYQHDALSLFPGVSDALTDLKQKGYALAVATGKGRNGLNKALEASNTRPFFAATRTVSECFSKPHPQMIQSICSELAVSEDRTLMIGDTTHDLQMAHNAGCAAIGVTTGAHDTEQLNTCPHLGLFADIPECLRWLG